MAFCLLSKLTGYSFFHILKYTGDAYLYCRETRITYICITMVVRLRAIYTSQHFYFILFSGLHFSGAEKFALKSQKATRHVWL